MNIKLHLQLAKEAGDNGDVLFHRAHLDCAAAGMVENYLNEKGESDNVTFNPATYHTQFVV